MTAAVRRARQAHAKRFRQLSPEAANGAGERFPSLRFSAGWNIRSVEFIDRFGPICLCGSEKDQWV
jgi:hypothetical protein